MKLSRREFVAGASALFLDGAVAEPARPKRKDCFFGLHFDLHPNRRDKELGRDVTDEMVDRLLRSVRPDFVQYDSKGHPGYLGYPSKTGMSASGIVKDSLAVWRRVTAAHGVGLYNHFSGAIDMLAIAKHPEWARIGPDGKPDAQQTSLFSAYERELMIPELLEAALNYDLDGCWVDGDCWAINPDYCEAARRKFADETGIGGLPKKPEEKGWNEFLEFERQQFREYVAEYADALHRAKAGFEITSNGMYTTLAPERPALPLDYLSLDLAEPDAVRQARLEARYLAQCGKPWDLMSWGFTPQTKTSPQAAKPLEHLEQEAAVILAQGGAYQIYNQPTRAGCIDGRIVEMAAEMARFCRDRQRWSHRSETIPEAGVLFSGHTVYSTGNRMFAGWDTTPAAGAIDLLLACGYSVDLIPDWKAAECVSKYPLLVVPDWREIGDEAAATAAAYVADGGKLLLWGAENASLFGSAFRLRLKGPAAYRAWFVGDGRGFAPVAAGWIEIEAPKHAIVANGYRSSGNPSDAVPLAVRVTHGRGTAIVCPTLIGSVYFQTASPILRSAMRPAIEQLHTPAVRLEGDYPAVEIALRKKDGQTLVHLINTARSKDSDGSGNAGFVPRTGPIPIRVRLAAAPSQAVLEPEGTPIAGEYEAGEWRATLPGLHVHSILRLA